LLRNYAPYNKDVGLTNVETNEFVTTKDYSDRLLAEEVSAASRIMNVMINCCSSFTQCTVTLIEENPRPHFLRSYLIDRVGFHEYFIGRDTIALLKQVRNSNQAPGSESSKD
jgi:hypothetical protein